MPVVIRVLCRQAPPLQAQPNLSCIRMKLATKAPHVCVVVARKIDNRKLRKRSKQTAAKLGRWAAKDSCFLQMVPPPLHPPTSITTAMAPAPAGRLQSRCCSWQHIKDKAPGAKQSLFGTPHAKELHALEHCHATTGCMCHALQDNVDAQQLHTIECTPVVAGIPTL